MVAPESKYARKLRLRREGKLPKLADVVGAGAHVPAPEAELKKLPPPESGWVYAILKEKHDCFTKGYAFLVQASGDNIFIALKTAKRAPGGRINYDVPYLVRLDPQSIGRPRALEIKEV